MTSRSGNEHTVFGSLDASTRVVRGIFPRLTERGTDDVGMGQCGSGNGTAMFFVIFGSSVVVILSVSRAAEPARCVCTTRKNQPPLGWFFHPTLGVVKAPSRVVCRGWVNHPRVEQGWFKGGLRVEKTTPGRPPIALEPPQGEKQGGFHIRGWYPGATPGWFPPLGVVLYLTFLLHKVAGRMALFTNITWAKY